MTLTKLRLRVAVLGMNLDGVELNGSGFGI